MGIERWTDGKHYHLHYLREQTSFNESVGIRWGPSRVREVGSPYVLIHEALDMRRTIGISILPGENIVPTIILRRFV